MITSLLAFGTLVALIATVHHIWSQSSAPERYSVVKSLATGIIYTAITIGLIVLFYALLNWTMLTIASIVLAALARVIYAGLTGR